MIVSLMRTLKLTARLLKFYLVSLFIFAVPFTFAVFFKLNWLAWVTGIPLLVIAVASVMILPAGVVYFIYSSLSTAEKLIDKKLQGARR